MKKLSTLILIVASLAMVSCTANMHTVGKGAQGSSVKEARQWYILWGLVPLNEVNTNQMAGDANDYEIKTVQSGLDVIMNIFTGMITVNSRTVTVTK